MHIAHAISLRPVEPEDEGFLYRVYASTREEELAPLGWDAAQKEAFLRMQFTAQSRHYQAYFPHGDHRVILHEGRPAGRLYLDRRAAEILIVDIALLPQFRNRGIGSFLLREVLDEAAAAGQVVRIHVEMFNPALRLYQQLGFKRVGDNGVYFLMECAPA